MGWNINPGVITRSVRGIPDDFKGDVIEKKAHMKDNITWGGTLSTSVELFGVKKKKNSNLQPTSTDSLLSISMGAKLGLNYNNYLGFGLEFSLTPSFTGGEKCMPGLSATMGLTADSRNGLGFTPNLSYSANIRSKAFDNTSLTSAGWTCRPSEISPTVTRGSASAAATRPGSRWCSAGMALKRWVA